MARLRNRIRKADYFTDGELLRWHRDKRATYSGLWAIAEDSGCLEDDPFSWKMLIWGSPLDSDITVETLEQWRDELIEAHKLIPYESEGKRYLFIRTFHQHEHPRNPQRPDLPLPEWVSYEITTGVGRNGKPWTRTAYRDTKYSVQNAARTENGSVQNESNAGFQPPPRPAPPRVPKGTSGKGVRDDGPVDKSTVRPVVPATSNGETHCWKCGGVLTADDMMDDHCVLSGRGIRHVRCHADRGVKRVDGRPTPDKGHQISERASEGPGSE